MSIRKIIAIVIVALLLIGAWVGYGYYNKIFGKNVIEDTSVYIRSNSSLQEVINELSPYIKNENSFSWVAEKKNYQNKIKGGHYLIKKGMNNNDLVDLLRSGEQTPIKVSFNNQETIYKLAGRIAEQIEADSSELVEAFLNNNFLSENKLSKETVLGIFIPNSYEVYWNTSAQRFANRMINEYNKFWNDSRIAKANKLNLTKNEVITLASIVQKETAIVSERPTVAGLYLNRIRSGWPLGADPTIIFALKQKYGQDKVYKRVLTKDLEIDSPYNTYKNLGLPPGPIAMPDISSIDAVLNDLRHDYYYMCASVEKLGYHEFAKTLEQHNRNARKYHIWVSQQGINR
ncbi:MAG: endolytic transglycosylase MltG [Flavobacteriaceae bacterium]|nr:endolytic transglycosylase MltG [Flavobacteriaceae bacterium]